MAKAALVNSKSIVENVIVWDDSCVVTDGLTPIVLDDAYQVSPGYTYLDGAFVCPESTPIQQLTYVELRRVEYPPMSDYLDGIVKGDQAQVQAYIDACLAVKAKYPKGTS